MPLPQCSKHELSLYGSTPIRRTVTPNPLNSSGFYASLDIHALLYIYVVRIMSITALMSAIFTSPSPFTSSAIFDAPDRIISMMTLMSAILTSPSPFTSPLKVDCSPALAVQSARMCLVASASAAIEFFRLTVPLPGNVFVALICIYAISPPSPLNVARFWDVTKMRIAPSSRLNVDTT